MNKLKLYIINLKTKPKRLESALKELNKIDLPLEINIFDAINAEQAKKLENEFVNYNAYKNLRANYSTLIIPTYGALGCAISHFKVWQMCKDNHLSLIVEDDILITDPIKLKFAIINVINCINLNLKYKLIPPKNLYRDCKVNTKKKRIASMFIMDPVHIYSCFENDFFNNNYYKEYDYLKCKHRQIQFSFENPFTGTHFYIINDLAAKLLTKTFLPLEYQLDLQLGLYASNFPEELYLYGIINSGVKQSDKFISDVQFSFLERNQFCQAFLKYKKYLSRSILNKIYSYMPKKKDNNYNYDYH